MKKIILLMTILISSYTWAYIPKATLILQKTAENSGAGVYQIEQEVQFPTSQDPVVLKETWSVENEDTMKLVVTGTREWKDQIKLVYVYQNGYRFFQNSQGRFQKKMNEDFFEKYFHYRKGEHLTNALINMKLIPTSILQKKPIGKLTKEADYHPESNVRLARSGGVINYAFGIPAADNQDSSAPGFWIEQDQFVIRKFRLPSQTEVTAEKYGSYPRGLNFPRTRNINWNNNHVIIQTIQVQPKPGNAKLFDPNNIESSTKIETLDALPSKALIDEFYKRFR